MLTATSTYRKHVGGGPASSIYLPPVGQSWPSSPQSQCCRIPPDTLQQPNCLMDLRQRHVAAWPIQVIAAPFGIHIRAELKVHEQGHVSVDDNVRQLHVPMTNTRSVQCSNL